MILLKYGEPFQMFLINLIWFVGRSIIFYRSCRIKLSVLNYHPRATIQNNFFSPLINTSQLMDTRLTKKRREYPMLVRRTSAHKLYNRNFIGNEPNENSACAPLKLIDFSHHKFYLFFTITAVTIHYTGFLTLHFWISVPKIKI